LPFAGKCDTIIRSVDSEHKNKIKNLYKSAFGSEDSAKFVWQEKPKYKEIVRKAESTKENMKKPEDIKKIVNEVKESLENNDWGNIIKLADILRKKDHQALSKTNKYINTYFHTTLHQLTRKYGIEKLEKLLDFDNQVNCRNLIKSAIEKNDWEAVYKWAKVAQEIKIKNS
jgi:acetyl-CoA carboxylase alpha subunit